MASPGQQSESWSIQLLVDSIPALIHTARPDGYLDYFNKRWLEYLGVTLDEVAGWNWTAVVHPEDVEGILAKWRASLATGEVFEYETRVRRANGEYRWMFHRKVPLRDANGDIVKWYGSSLDIDERKSAEEQLRRNAQELRHREALLAAEKRLLEMIATGVALQEILNALCLIIEDQRSGTLASVLLLNPDGLHLRFAAGPNVPDQWTQQMEKLPIGPCAGSCGTAAYRRSRVIVSDIASDPLWNVPEHRASALKHGLRASWSSPVLSSKGNVLGTFCMYYREPRSPDAGDLELIEAATHLVEVAIERDRAEKGLRRSEAYLAEAQRLSQTGSFGWKPDSGEIVWSDETYRIFEYDGSVKPTIDSVVQRAHPDVRALVQQVIDRASQTGTDFAHEYRLLMPDGRVKHVHAMAHALKDASGNCEFVGAVTDITERKKAEEALRSSEAYLEEAQRLSHTGSFGCKPSSGEMLWSEETFRIYGYDHTTTPAVEAILRRVHPEDKAEVEAHIARATSEGKDCDLEYRLLLPDDSIKHVHVMAHVVKDESAEFEFVGAVTDITERKHAEEELQQLVDFVRQIITVLSPNGKITYANRVAREYTGLTLAEYRSVDVLARVIHPDDVDRMRAVRERGLSANNPFEIEARTLGKGGVCRWFLYRYNPLRDERGQITRWYVTGTDIEDRKQAEDRLRQENVALREEINQASMFEDIVGTSPALQTVLSNISKVAPSDSTVLITGETGTGKELVARAIHRRSNRASRAFVSVNCAAIPRDLIASELFGHEKGAFTGATQQRLGRFELASGGTIFLDEVGELPTETQIALLRVLQEHEFERVGGSRRIRADVRVIAATNRDLQAAISAGSFRSDLFYRLNVFPIEMPSLRERRADIPLLVEYFIDRYARKARKNIKRVNKKTLELLQLYPWPGNIRELQNVIERSVILCESDIFSIDESWLPRQSLPATESKQHLELPRRLETQEKDLIEEALKASRGRIFGPTGAAAKLGIPRSTLESKIKSLKINKNRFRT